MKIGLIVAANLKHTPYVNHYIEIMEKNGISYEILEFNKLGIKQTNLNIISYNYFCRYDESIIKKIYGYLKFKNFCIKTIKRKKYDKLIIFIPQFAMFMGYFLSKKYENNYILDIRDYNNFFKVKKIFEKLIKNSNISVISSPGFKKWLPTNKEYIINHNIEITHIENKKKYVYEKRKQKKIVVLNAGIIRSFKENLYLMRQIKNNEKIELEYRGESPISQKLNVISNEENIKNCNFFSSYEKNEEIKFYLNADLINIMQSDDFLSKDAMPNRFYTALIAKKPILATSGNLVGDLVKKLNLGLVISKDLNEREIDFKIVKFFEEYNEKEFQKKCEKLLKKILVNEQIFQEKILNYLKEEK